MQILSQLGECGKFYLQILTLFLSVNTHLLRPLEMKLGERD